MKNDCYIKGIVISKNKKDIEDVVEYLKNKCDYNVKEDFIFDLGIFNMEEIRPEDTFWDIILRYENLCIVVDYYEKLLSKKDVNTIEDKWWIDKYIKPNYIIQDVDLLRNAMDKIQHIERKDFKNWSLCINIWTEEYDDEEIIYNEDTKEYRWDFDGICEWSLRNNLYFMKGLLEGKLPKGIRSLLTFEEITKERPDLKVILESEENTRGFSEFFGYYRGERIINRVAKLTDDYIKTHFYKEVPAWYSFTKEHNYDLITDIELNKAYMIDSLNKAIENNNKQKGERKWQMIV